MHAFAVSHTNKLYIIFVRWVRLSLEPHICSILSRKCQDQNHPFGMSKSVFTNLVATQDQNRLEADVSECVNLHYMRCIELSAW